MARPISLQANDLDLTHWIQRGDRIIWTQGVAEPLTLLERLISQRSAIGRVHLFVTVSFESVIRPEHRDYFTIEGLGGLGVYHHLSQARAIDPHPVHLSHFCNSIALGIMPIDVAMVQLAGPDQDGNYSAGFDHTYTHDIIRRARVVIAEINSAAPITPGIAPISPDDLDVIVPTSRPLPTVPTSVPDLVDRDIAEIVANMVPDGATLEVGIGALPSAILTSLHNHRNIGIHTGIITSAVLNLMSSGAVTNTAKSSDTGRSTASSLILGEDELSTISDHEIMMRPSREILDVRRIAELPKFTAINSALQVDLTGQVNAEYAGSRYVGAVGGQVDFVRGARASNGGLSITVLRSRTNDGASKIVPSLAGGIVTLGRSDVDVVVTEWGAVHLSNMSIRQRSRSLISVAHPGDRSRLFAEWQKISRADAGI